jgi:hypothetical protein
MHDHTTEQELKDRLSLIEVVESARTLLAGVGKTHLYQKLGR